CIHSTFSCRYVIYLTFLFFFFYLSCHLPYLLSFPTRRSSDLVWTLLHVPPLLTLSWMNFFLKAFPFIYPPFLYHYILILSPNIDMYTITYYPIIRKHLPIIITSFSLYLISYPTCHYNIKHRTKYALLSLVSCLK